VSAPVRSERAGDVRVVELSVPERRNALSRGMLAAVRAELREPAAAVVVTGSAGVFSAGADLRELTGTAADRAVDDEIARTVDALRDLPVPTIAAIEGACVGAAIDLALACDVRIAGADAFFALPAVRLGLLYAPRATLRMRRTIRPDTLARLLLLDERIAAGEAVPAGLVSRCVAAGRARAEAVALASRAPADSAAAMRATKALLVDDDPDPDAWEAMRTELLASPRRRAAVADAQARMRAPA
jgi:enoyl-CoA hydratase/carnithine racemase